MRDTPAISVVIPTHNRLEILLRALSRLASGAEVPEEVIIVDDGSEQPVEPAVHARAFSFPNVQVIRLQPGRGAPVARNTGARAATGDIILFLDDDVMAETNTIAAHRRLHMEHAADNYGVMGRIFFDPELCYTPLLHWLEHRGDFKTIANGKDGVFQAGLISANFSLRRSFLERQQRLFDVNFPFNRSEDNEFGYRMVATAGWNLHYHTTPSAAHYSPLDIHTYFKQTYQGGICKTHWALQGPDATVFALNFGQAFFMKQREQAFRQHLEHCLNAFSDVLDAPAQELPRATAALFDDFMRFSRQAMQDIGQFDGWLSLSCVVSGMCEALTCAFSATTIEERLTHLKTAHQLDPLFFPMAWFYAEQLCRAGHWQSAERVMAPFPDNAWALLMRCTCAFAAGEGVTAIGFARAALALALAPTPPRMRQQKLAQEFLDKMDNGVLGDECFAIAWLDPWKDGLHRLLSWSPPMPSAKIQPVGVSDIVKQLTTLTMEKVGAPNLARLYECPCGGAPAARMGRIHWYTPVKRFGFIRPGRGDRMLMFHHTQIRTSSEQTLLRPGLPVAFTPVETALGLEAHDVHVVEDADFPDAPQGTASPMHNAVSAWNRPATRHVVFMGLNTSKAFSGGRYHAWLMAEAAAEMGWQVSFITNDHPSFYHDFDDQELFPAHKSIEVHIVPLKWNHIRKLSGIPCDLLVTVPHGSHDVHLYDAALKFARERHAKIMLLNFESANWYNALSPTPRPEEKWNGWKTVAGHASMILSLTAEGTGYAREFYTNAPRHALFEHCWPTVNDRIADTLPPIPREKRILILTRFSHAEHKGGELVPELLCEAMRGYTIVFIVGAGHPDAAFLKPIEQRASDLDIKIELLGRVSELDKWREFKRASLVLFPSYFEGYGIPPVEARYAGTPCIAFDLPVLREVNGEDIVYVAPGDVAKMRQRSADVLNGSIQLTGCEPSGFDDFARRLHALFQRALYECAP